MIFGNTVTNNLVSKLLNGVFMIQPPVSPNKLTNDMAIAEKWIHDRIKDYLLQNKITI